MGKLGFLDGLKNFPEKIQDYVRNQMDSSLRIDTNVNGFKFEDKGFSGYRVILRPEVGKAGAEISLYFDSDGDLIWQHYYGAGQ